MPVSRVKVSPGRDLMSLLTPSDHPGLSPPQHQISRKVAAMMTLSFEVDTLEIVLRELSDLVDVFFLVESNGTHKGVDTH